MTEIRTASRRRFVRHFLEMVAAMIVGMMVLGPLWELVFAGLGWTELFARADLGALVMATDMTVAMTLLMRYRGHGWAATAEMAAAMYVPFVVLFVPFWLGIIDGATLLVAGHVLMLPCMLGAMLLRRDEYTGDHRARTRKNLVDHGKAAA